MSEAMLSGIPSMTVGKVIENLSFAYCTLINNKKPVSMMPSVMLWGPPGSGKSQAVRQIASEIEYGTGKKTKVTDVRLLLYNPVDLKGIPTASADKTLAVWLRPKIFDMDPSEDTVNILFLDEISAAPPTVQAAAYQITLDRVVGEHSLPDNCIVIAAGNRTTDKSVAYRMPKALANRLMHIEVDISFDMWRKWAVSAGIHPKIVGFLSFRQNFLMGFDPSNDDLAFATPRTWEMASNILNEISGDIDKAYPFIAGILGVGTAAELRTWCRIYRELPSIEDIFDGKMPPLPHGTAGMYALSASMTAYAREHKEQLGRIANSIRYAEKMPPDFSVILLKDYMAIEKGYRDRLMTIPEFSRWLRSRGGLLNGAV